MAKTTKAAILRQLPAARAYEAQERKAGRRAVPCTMTVGAIG